MDFINRNNIILDLDGQLISKFLESNKTKRNVISIKMNKFVAKHMKLEDIKDDDKWQLIGNISTKEELENGKGFNYGGSQIFVQHKKVFWFIKELTLLVDSIKVKGNIVCATETSLDETKDGKTVDLDKITLKPFEVKTIRLLPD